MLGEHPLAPLLAFSSVKVDGRPYSVNETVKSKVREELKNYLGSFEALKAGRSSGWTTASGIAATVRAIVEDSGALLDCSAVVSGEYGYTGFSLGIPAVIGKGGIRQILEFDLAYNEYKELESLAAVLQENSNLVRRLIDSKRL